MPTTGSQQEQRCVAVPANSTQEGLGFLESIASGNIGAGVKMTSQGQTIPSIRTEYKTLIDNFERDLQKKIDSGTDARKLAEWAVSERTRVARQMRAKQGGGAHIVLELRDNMKYGLGGRTYDNFAKRATSKGVPANEIPHRLLKNATKPNQAISNAAVDGAKFLKNGGRVVVFISISATAYTLLTAKQEELERLFYEELGGITGGALGGGLAVSACIVFGIATSGWGLLACGVVGGGAGGVLGSSAGNRVYKVKDEYLKESAISTEGFEVYRAELFIGK